MTTTPSSRNTKTFAGSPSERILEASRPSTRTSRSSRSSRRRSRDRAAPRSRRARSRRSRSVSPPRRFELFGGPATSRLGELAERGRAPRQLARLLAGAVRERPLAPCVVWLTVPLMPRRGLVVAARLVVVVARRGGVQPLVAGLLVGNALAA